jgi:hypothetical protein
MIKNKYSSYIWVDENFNPVFGKEVDKTNKTLWKSFIPHSKFTSMLETTLKALERGRDEDKKSIWMHGGYGTGKTHAAFVLKHIFEDDVNEVKDYFKIREFSSSLGDRLLKFRERNNVLVIFKSGSSQIRSSERLLLDIQESVYLEYKKYVGKTEAGNDYIPCKTEIQLLRDRINENTYNWDTIIKKYRRELREIPSVEYLKQELDKENLNFEFIDRLLRVLVKEGISLFKFSTDKFKEWLAEIYKRDNIKILVIWDEFTQFFKSKESPVDTLQEISQITRELPFYMFIITHFSEHRINSLSDDVSKLRDRFFGIHYSMESITTYELISQIIQVREHKKAEWNNFKADIFNSLTGNYHLDNVMSEMMHFEPNLNKNILLKLFPLHPYSAYLLSQLAQWFGSTNRTIFKFFKSEDKTKKHFMDLLREYPHMGDYLLTPELLWDYFFDNDSIVDYPELINIMSHWNRYKNDFTGDELKVFKSIILLLALSLKITAEIVKPSKDNLKMAFAGTPIYNKLNDILNDFTKKRHIFREYKSFNKVEYGIPSYDIDSEKIEEIKKEIDFEKYFERIKREIDYEFENNIFSKNRWVIKAIPAQKILKGKFPTSEFKLVKPYQMGVSLIVMDTLDRIGDLKKKVELLSQKPEHKNMIFLISYSELGEETWDSMKTHMAHEKLLSSSNKHREANYYGAEIKKIISQWITDIKQGRFQVAYIINNDLRTHERIDGIYGSKHVFNEIFNKRFPYGMDDCDIPNTLLRNQNSKDGITIPLEQFRIRGNKGKWKALYDKFALDDKIIDKREGNFIDDCNTYEQNHPLIVMRKMIKDKFDKDDKLSLKEIWHDLQRPPFGLYPSPLASYIFGLLMKEYSKGYYCTNGTVSYEISPAKMVESIYDTITMKKSWELLKLSDEQVSFCKLMGEIFGLSIENIKYPNKAINSMRYNINNIYKFPLWILKYDDSDINDFEEMNEIKNIVEVQIQTLDSIIKQMPENTDDISIKSIDHLIKKFINEFGTEDSFNYQLVLSRLKDKINIEVFKKSFQIMVDEHIHSDMNISIESLNSHIRHKLQGESWSWDENKVIEVMDKINTELILSKKLLKIFECNEFTPMFLEKTCQSILEKIKNNNLYPLWIYTYHKDSNVEINNIFHEIKYLIESMKNNRECDYSKIKRLVEDMAKHEEILKQIILDSLICVKQWAKGILKREVSDEEFSEISRIIHQESSINPLVEENTLSNNLKKKIDKLKITKLREKINYKLKILYNTSDFLCFCRDSYIPPCLIKYIPEINNIGLSDEFFKNLNGINRLPEDELNEIYNKLERYERILKILNDEDISYKLFSNFFGEKWIENILSKDDWDNLYEYLKNKYGTNVEKLDEQKIKSSFDKWKSNKYNEMFYDKVKTKIDRMEEQEIKQLMSKIVKNPDIGFQIMDILHR